MFNCPNCGAPVVYNKCEYCGTVFTDKNMLEEELTDAIIRFNQQLQVDYILGVLHGSRKNMSPPSVERRIKWNT